MLVGYVEKMEEDNAPLGEGCNMWMMGIDGKAKISFD